MTRRRARAAVRAVVGLGLCCASCTATVTGSPSAVALPKTEVVVANPFTAAGEPAADVTVVEQAVGSCQDSNLASGNPQARRCFTEDSSVLDPCFLPAGRLAERALCLSDPTAGEAVELRVTDDSALPPGEHSYDGDPWFLELVNGLECQLLGGATVVFQGLRMNYACGPDRYLYGSPDRQQDTWTIRYGSEAPAELTSVPVRTAWF
ncbi:hypothetical protein [Actinophytocola xanthii]|uniref:Ricin B lectin domain-containing protein n=1 Tax=Actinophytocola xanthii TaxID=1912961 RepID=A0A1Q8C8Y8_9PSEU|nr:hypothetical protein [Actinophytocola xanthii]OLF10821.1 hypothetical protein BU204_30920 [Actinophytocola xanthii]